MVPETPAIVTPTPPVPPQSRLLHLKLSKTHIMLGIILLLILILAAVFLFMNFSQEAQSEENLSVYWESSDISFTSLLASPTAGISVKITNYLLESVEISKITFTGLDGTSYGLSEENFTLTSGENKLLTDASITTLCVTPGATIALRIRVDYIHVQSKARYSTFGQDNLLYGTCQG